MSQHARQHHTLLTGATGLIGHHLLARLLDAGTRCAVVVRNPMRGSDRLVELLSPLGVDTSSAFEQERLVLLRGDLLDGIEAPASLRISQIIHLAGCTRFDLDANGDPGRTNVCGTQRLLEWASCHGITRFHLASTAYAGGRTHDIVHETPLPQPEAFNNEYEHSKWQCERSCTSWAQENHDRCATILRPSIVVGDWDTGRTTSFSGLYLAIRAIQAAAALSAQGGSNRVRRVDVRFRGAATGVQNIVPVSYVADMMAAIVTSSAHHGGFFNLVHPAPPSNDLIRRAVETALNIRGLAFSDGLGLAASRSRLQRLFDRKIAPLWPYLNHAPRFTRTRAAAVEAAARICCPSYDLPALVRMCAFAVREPERCSTRSSPSMRADMAAEFFERFLPQQVQRSVVAQTIALTADVRFTLTDIVDGAWLCRFQGGRLGCVIRSASCMPEDFGYRVDAATFLGIVSAQLDPQEAFLSGRIEVTGDIERALKLAMVLHQFSSEFPFQGIPARGVPAETVHA